MANIEIGDPKGPPQEENGDLGSRRDTLDDGGQENELAKQELSEIPEHPFQDQEERSGIPVASPGAVKDKGNGHD